MQREPLLLSSAKLGILKKDRSISLGDIILLFLISVFVIIGAVDLISRAFAPSPSHENIEVIEDSTATSTPVISVAPFAPTQLSIRKIGVNAIIEPVGRKEDGTMKTPSTFDTTAWWSEGSLAGAEGNTVIAGHLNNALDRSGVFEHLGDLTLGDTITLSDQNGREAVYVVQKLSVYETANAPTESIFKTEGPSRAVFITCDGAFDKGKRSYDKRLVVYADLVSGH